MDIHWTETYLCLHKYGLHAKAINHTTTTPISDIVTQCIALGYVETHLSSVCARHKIDLVNNQVFQKLLGLWSPWDW